MNGVIEKISGPLVIANNMVHANLFDVVYVGEKELIGEIIEMHEGRASIQVYEETAGLKTGETVKTLGHPLSVELGPGLIGSIYDGIQRPLTELEKRCGDRLLKGVHTNALDRTKKWNFIPHAKKGQKVVSGDVLGTVQETDAVVHKILVPPNISGQVTEIFSGEFTVNDTIATIDGKSIAMLSKWPVRRGRPYKQKLPPNTPLSTGQRVIDALFPLAKGGVAAVPGPFGSGKTVVQHQLAKWSDTDIVVYIGCGERGNEMTDVLNEFPEITDPKTGKTLMERTILIANTSDMPVAAREASIYTGVTIAEYFRDMGYSVILLADSTSRWAEALREMSGRLEEMPGEEGYPAYLSSRLAGFYERAGNVVTGGTKENTGSLTMIGAVSPPGGDISEPVSQATLRIVKVFWGLDSSLAYKRHFPAINWLSSYSLYTDNTKEWYINNLGEDYIKLRDELVKILQEEAQLDEIVRLIGIDALGGRDRVTLETAKMVREDFLHQNAFDEVDTYSSYNKIHIMMKLILDFHNMCMSLIDKGVEIDNLLNLPSRNKIGRIKYIKEENLQGEYENIKRQITNDLNTGEVSESA